MTLKSWSHHSTDDGFSRAIGMSVALHLAVLVVFTFQSFLKPKPLIDISQAISVNLADLPATDKLPEKIQPQAHEAVESAPVAEEKVETPEPKSKQEKIEKKTVEKTKPVEKEINLKQAKLKQKQALDRIKKMAALDKIKQSLKADAIKNIAASQKTKARRVIAAGSPLTGLDKIEATEYLLQLDARIKEVWTLPQWLISKKLKAQVLVKFDQNGKVISSELLQPSGNSSYDRYCLQAVEAAAPFPAVPEKFSEKFRTDGLVIGFPE